eukprot:TRINITY_DN5202_c0_g1_i1.p1 TRINITY_DN5202_c0_g1~~TRINITY_DN5202_c0_g1_i1.p1  ORF type:complete len:1237 (+),score=394.46 TRINITY_DN5202_c0_g1_i1:56-3712(+)
MVVGSSMSTSLFSPGVFPGKLHKENRGGIDWGIQGLIAYASHFYVVIVDPENFRVIQTLDDHKSCVTHVKWSKESLHSNLDKPYRLRLASADKSGVIFIWSVEEASIIHCLVDQNTQRPVTDLLWMDGDATLLLVLYGPNILILWNTETGQRIWRQEVQLSPVHLNRISGASVPNFSKENSPESLKFLLSDPQQPDRALVASQNGGIYIIEDVYDYAEGPTSSIPGISSRGSGRGTAIYSFSVATSRFAFGDLLGASFSHCRKGSIYFQFAKEIVSYDIYAHQVIGVAILDRNRTLVSSMLTWSREEPFIVTLHEDASFVGWEKKKGDPSRYEIRNISDILKFGKPTRKKGVHIVSVVNRPTDEENRIVLVTSDGTLWQWIYQRGNPDVDLGSASSSNLMTMYSSFESTGSKFKLLGNLEPISSPISSLNTLPSSQDTSSDRTLIAIGTFQGTLQIVDVEEQVVVSEMALWHHVVRGVRWVNKDTVMVFGCEEVNKEEYRNHLILVDVRTMKTKEIRKLNSTENTFIRGIRVSPAGQYVAVLLRERPFEVWDLRTCTLIRTMKPYSAVTSLEWAPYYEAGKTSAGSNPSKAQREGDLNYIREVFVFSLTDGTLKAFTVEPNGNVVNYELQTDINASIVSSIAWKNFLMVAGDTMGNLYCWNFRTKRMQTFSTGKGLVRKIRFSPSNSVHHILVLFNEGDFGIWDLDYSLRISMSNYLRQRDLKTIDVDWLNDAMPVVATNDGCLRVLDRSLSVSNSALDIKSLERRITVQNPYLLGTYQSLKLKVFLQHLAPNGPRLFSYESNGESEEEQEKLNRERDETEAEMLLRLNPDFLRDFIDSESLVERCIKTSKFFGDQEEFVLWSLLQNVLKDYERVKAVREEMHEYEESRKKAPETPPTPVKAVAVETPKNVEPPSSPLSSSATNFFTGLDHKTPQNTMANNIPGHLEYLLPSETVIHREKIKSAIFEKKTSGSSYEFAQKAASHNILLGQKDKAQLNLLATPTENSNYLIDNLRAALVAATISPNAFKLTARTAAVSLVSSGRIQEGIELFTLIGMSFEACEYLQQNHLWEQSIYLAKVSLNEVQSGVIHRRWAKELAKNPMERMKAVQILLTLGEFHPAIQLLYDMKMPDKAALLASILIERKIIDIETKLSKEAMISSFANNQTPLQQLVHATNLDYGNHLNSLGNRPAAEYYFKRAGAMGEHMMESLKAEENSGF